MNSLVTSKKRSQIYISGNILNWTDSIITKYRKHHTCSSSLHPTPSSRTIPLSKISKDSRDINWTVSHMLVILCYKDRKNGKESGVSSISTPLYFYLLLECVSALLLITFRGEIFQTKITSRKIPRSYLNTWFFPWARSKPFHYSLLHGLVFWW